MSDRTANDSNPFSKMGNIENSQTLLDVAFRKAMKIKPPKSRTGKVDQIKVLESNRINTASNVLIGRLERIVHGFPSINLLHPFYSDLLNIIMDINQVKKNLGRMYGVKFTISEINQELIDEIQSIENVNRMKSIRRTAFGRFSSLIYGLDKGLKTLEQARTKLSTLPGYNPSIPCVVVCGLPNVGKSSFIKSATSGKPEVASYPFTTKKLIFGHRKYGYLNIQFVDTPGLLDRNFSERNEIELQALAALKHLADIMLFLFDLSVDDDDKVMQQINLLKKIQKFYPTSSFLVIITKSDILTKEKIDEGKELLLKENLVREEDILIITIKSENGIVRLIERIENLLKQNILVSTKFREIMQFTIDEDELEFSEEDLWFLDD